MASFAFEILADAGEAEAALGKVAETAEASAGKIKGAFSDAGESISKSLKSAAERVSEALGDMIKKFVDAGMSANASAESIAAGFDKLTGLKTEPIVEAIDKTKDYVTGLKQLSETVPLSLGKIVELKAAMEANGVATEKLPEILHKLTSNMADAAGDSRPLQEAFRTLGVSTENWHTGLPQLDTVLVQIAAHLQSSKNPAADLAAAEKVLGDNAALLIPMLRQGADSVRQQAEAHAGNARVIEGSVSAFEHLHATEAQLSEALQNLLVPVFRVLGQALDLVLQGILKVIEGFNALGRACVATGKLITDLFRGLGKITVDAVQPIFAWLKEILAWIENKLSEAAAWFAPLARATLAAFNEIKTFFVNLLQPIFQKISDGVGLVLRKFDDLKQWLGQVKDAALAMAAPVIDAFHRMSKAVADFFHLHWDAAIHDAEATLGQLRGDAANVAASLKGSNTVDAAHQFGAESGDGSAGAEARKTEAVKHGVNQRLGIASEAQNKQHQQTLRGTQQEIADYNSAFSAINASQQQFLNQQLDQLMTGLNRHGQVVLKADGKSLHDQENAESQSLLFRRKLFDGFFREISSGFSSFVHGILSGTESIGQAWSKMVQQMSSAILQELQKQLEAFIQHKVQELLFHAKTEVAKNEITKDANQKDDSMTAVSAAKIAFKETLRLGPIVGPILAPVAAAAAFAGVAAFGSAEGGQYLVPAPQLTMLHAQEMVLPAGLASRMRDVIEGGGGTHAHPINVVVQHSVNAIDAGSFQSVIRRHGNMIGNEVARVLKKKAFGQK